MAMSTGGGGGVKAEPNVTPMIDVMLVLLIIFMIVVPMGRKAIDLQLPAPTPIPHTQPNPQQIILEVAKDGSYMINKNPVAHGDLDRKLREIYDPRPDKIIFVKGDPEATYQVVLAAMDVARGAGVKVIGVPPRDVK